MLTSGRRVSSNQKSPGNIGSSRPSWVGKKYPGHWQSARWCLWWLTVSRIQFLMTGRAGLKWSHKEYWSQNIISTYLTVRLSCHAVLGQSAVGRPGLSSSPSHLCTLHLVWNRNRYRFDSQVSSQWYWFTGIILQIKYNILDDFNLMQKLHLFTNFALFCQL